MGNFAAGLSRLQPTNDRIDEISSDLKGQIDETKDGLGALVEAVETNKQNIEKAVAALGEQLTEAIKQLAQKQESDAKDLNLKHVQVTTRADDLDANVMALAKATLGYEPELNPAKDKPKDDNAKK